MDPAVIKSIREALKCREEIASLRKQKQEIEEKMAKVFGSLTNHQDNIRGNLLAKYKDQRVYLTVDGVGYVVSLGKQPHDIDYMEPIAFIGEIKK